MLDTHDTESVEEDEMISSIDSVIDRTSNEVAIELFQIVRVTSSHVKEKPCEKEMNLFSECLTQGNKCDEFEDSYFKCIESMHQNLLFSKPFYSTSISFHKHRQISQTHSILLRILVFVDMEPTASKEEGKENDNQYFQFFCF